MLGQQLEKMQDRQLLYRIDWHEGMARMYEAAGYIQAGKEFRELAGRYRKELGRRQDDEKARAQKVA